MFFFFSKILLNLIFPATWIGIALLCALVIKSLKAKRVYLILASAIFIIFSNPFLLNSFARYWDIEGNGGNRKYSCAIVLGGFVAEDQNSKGYFNGASDRFIQALKLKISGKADYLLFSGGNASLRPSGFREAAWLSQELKYFNIADSAVLIEKASRNTLENAKFSRKLLKSKKLEPPYLLVTSAFHMRRSLQTFKRAGLDVVPYSCHYIAAKEKITLSSFFPDLEVMVKWNFYVKEIVGSLTYYFKTLNHKAPK